MLTTNDNSQSSFQIMDSNLVINFKIQKLTFLNMGDKMKVGTQNMLKMPSATQDTSSKFLSVRTRYKDVSVSD